MDVFAPLNGHAERIPLHVLEAWLRDVTLSLDDVRRRLCFHPRHYVRNLLHSGPCYHALLLCWRNGQRSPIHDHQGSSCGVKVLAGTALETVFARAENGMVYPERSCQQSEGYVFASQDDDIHQVSNLQAGGADLITLHIYSPPLMHMNVYSLEDPEVKRVFDPVNDEFASGGGI